MTESLVPWVRLYRNPWSEDTLEELELLAALDRAADSAREQLLKWLEAGKVSADVPYACVLLDPTRRTPEQTLQERLMGSILFGSQGAYSQLGGAAANADRFDRRGACESTTYHGGIVAAGHGMDTEEQNQIIASLVVRNLVEFSRVGTTIAAMQTVLEAPTINPRALLSCGSMDDYTHVMHAMKCICQRLSTISN